MEVQRTELRVRETLLVYTLEQDAGCSPKGGFELFKVLSMGGERCDCPGSVQVVEPHSRRWMRLKFELRPPRSTTSHAIRIPPELSCIRMFGAAWELRTSVFDTR